MAIRLFLLVALSICGSLGKAVDEPASLKALPAVANDVHKFSSELYQVTGKEEQGNFVSSPISVSIALSMLTYGAGGNTQNQLKTALHFNDDETVQKEGLKNLVENLKNSLTVNLTVASNIFVANDRHIEPTFINITESVFNSTTQQVDYSNPQEASGIINKWCEEQTHSKIKEIVSADDLSSDTALVLVNAVYFNGKWLEPFKKGDTYPAPFYLEDGTTKNVTTMHHGYLSGNWGELHKVNATFVELVYEDRTTSLVIILPNDPSGLKEFESNLHKISARSLLEGYQVKVDISLPRFKIESEIDLKAPLIKLGMNDMFENSANLTGIVDSPLKVSKIVHKAVIEVSEEGITAAAGTGIGIAAVSADIQVEFNVNRPFYYAIVKRLTDQRDGVVLFHGHYKNVD